MGSNISTGDLIQQQYRGNWKVVTLVDGVVGGVGVDTLDLSGSPKDSVCCVSLPEGV